jgi:hypothetical protein
MKLTRDLLEEGSVRICNHLVTSNPEPHKMLGQFEEQMRDANNGKQNGKRNSLCLALQLAILNRRDFLENP